jgi:RNA polymerase sigma-70 factor (ECF subfamily)
MTLCEFDRVLAAAQEGAEWAFARLYREFNPRLLRCLRPHALQAADDLAADTCLVAARQLAAFEGDERASGPGSSQSPTGS